MNLLKSVFISAFVSWLAVVSFYAFIQLARGTDPLLAWLGLALTAFAPLVFFLKAFLFKSPRTPRHPVEYSVLSGLGLAMTMAMSFRYGDATGVIHVWAGITLLGWFVYLRWYSVFQGRNSQTLSVGNKLPLFDLESMDGQVVSSESFMAKPHLLLFYRGNWCPFCTAQIEELAAAYQQLEEVGINVVLISPQPIKKNLHLAARFKVPMTFLRDKEGTAAKQLSIQHEWGTPMGMQVLGYESDSVLPTLLLTDVLGHIIYSDQTDNYRVRPEPKDSAVLLTAKGEDN
ncbi:MAG: peroxiredoxin family protein [Xanthomonadales bacterium]|nr:peroxiredoxin family protein [Xanthomonadales bacterium]